MKEYPWAEAAWESAATAAAAGALHHGLLITGAPGMAKREFAVALSQLLLCTESQSQPCNQCQNCTLFTAGTHPDFHVLTTEQEWRDRRVELVAKYCNRYQDVAAREKRAQEKSRKPGQVIPVDHVRLLIERFGARPHIAARKVALILPAERMNVNAANALLKLLEEPPADAFLLLVSALPGHLPATVRSRCLKIPIPPPAAEQAAAWLGARLPDAGGKSTATQVRELLALANGGPLAALRMHDADLLPLHRKLREGVAELAGGKTSALELAALLVKQDFSTVIDWLHRLCCDLIRENCGVASGPTLGKNAPNPTRLSAERLFTLYDKIGAYRKIARDPINEQLAMEELMLALRGAMQER